MTATIKNTAGEARDIPLAGGTVEDGDTFEVEDDVFWRTDWEGDIFEVVEPSPPSSRPAAPQDVPAKNAKKAEWIDYAVNTLGADPAAVEDMTVAQLIETYGQEN